MAFPPIPTACQLGLEVLKELKARWSLPLNTDVLTLHAALSSAHPSTPHHTKSRVDDRISFSRQPSIEDYVGDTGRANVVMAQFGSVEQIDQKARSGLQCSVEMNSRDVFPAHEKCSQQSVNVMLTFQTIRKIQEPFWAVQIFVSKILVGKGIPPLCI